MNEPGKEQIEAAIAEYREPYLDMDLVSAKAIKSIAVDSGVIRIAVELGFPADGYKERLERALTERLSALPGATGAQVEVRWSVVAHAVQPTLKPLGSVRNIIAVASGKGGVGKSTTAANLALALRADGARVGLLDADIYGPSQPRMLGVRSERPQTLDGKSMRPVQALGLSCMSIGFLIDEDQPMVWRGPMVTQALNQLLTETDWGELDYLLIDMPPGTGDIQLTLSQNVPVSGALIVTTPQDIALLDAVKGLKMFEKVNVRVLGVVENMSTHICSACGHEEPIFGEGGGARMASNHDVPLLGAIPLDLSVREEADGGRPTVVSQPDGEIAQRYMDIARRMSARLSLFARDYSRLFPKISIEDN